MDTEKSNLARLPLLLLISGCFVSLGYYAGYHHGMNVGLGASKAWIREMEAAKERHERGEAPRFPRFPG